MRKPVCGSVYNANADRKKVLSEILYRMIKLGADANTLKICWKDEDRPRRSECCYYSFTVEEER